MSFCEQVSCFSYETMSSAEHCFVGARRFVRIIQPTVKHAFASSFLLF